MPRAERRVQIIAAGAAAFLRAGFDGTSMDDVAKQAGVTRLIVYRIFESKEQLYRAVLDTVLDDLADCFVDRQSELAAHGGVSHLLLGVARRQPDAFRLLWRHAAHEPMFREYASAFHAGVEGYADALLQPPISEPALRRWAVRTVTAYHYDGICAWLDDGGFDGDAERDRAFELLLSNGSRALVHAWHAAPPPLRPPPPAPAKLTRGFVR